MAARRLVPADYYREALENRDDLAAVVDELPPAAAGPLVEALARIDEAFRTGSREAGVNAAAIALGIAAGLPSLTGRGGADVEQAIAPSQPAGC